jgi:hypothetical protein
MVYYCASRVLGGYMMTSGETGGVEFRSLWFYAPEVQKTYYKVFFFTI